MTAADALLTEALRARGHRVTAQRLVLFRALHELARHASADEVLDAVHDRLPGLSLPTVYATLDLLEHLGLLRRISSGAGPALYDPNLDGHHHLVCRSCGRVDDVRAVLSVAPVVAAARERGFEAVAPEVVVRGLCPACAPAHD